MNHLQFYYLASAFETIPSLRLKSVNLRGNQIGDDGACSFASAFEKNTSWNLQSLSLQGNKIGDDSIEFILERNISLVEIYCDYEQEELKTAIIRTQAPLQRWNETSLNPEILKARENVEIRVLLSSLQKTSIGPARQLSTDIVKLIGSKLVYNDDSYM